MRGVLTFGVLALFFLSCDIPDPLSGSCSVKDEGDGTKTISCPDGTSATLSDGASGASGAQGATGTGCSVSTSSDAGVRIITCTDGTSVTVSNGATGPSGPSGARGDAGAPGVAWVLRLEAERPGTHCVTGGTRILSGPDTNANGLLDVPSEVRTTAWVCNGEWRPPCTTLEGSLTIRNSLDWANLVTAGCTTITGELAIEAPGVTTLDPVATALVSVGSLRVQNNDVLKSLSLPALTSAGRVEFHGNEGLTSVELPQLITVGSTLSFTQNRALEELQLPVLASVDGALTVQGNLALKEFTAPALRTIMTIATMGGELTVSDNTALRSVSLPALAAVAGSVEVRANLSLTELSLPSLTSVNGTLTVESNAALRQCLVDEVMRQLTSGPSSYVAAQNDGMPNTCP